MIVTIIVILLIIGGIGALIENIGEIGGRILGVIAGGAILIAAFFLLKFLFGQIVKWVPILFDSITEGLQFVVNKIHLGICLIPKKGLYIYISLFLLFIILQLLLSISNANMDVLMKELLQTQSIIGNIDGIIRKIQKEPGAEINTFRMSFPMFRINSPLCKQFVTENCIAISKGMCSVGVLKELSGILDDLGMATDTELVMEIEKRGAQNSKAVNIIKNNYDDIHLCLSNMESYKMCTSNPVNFDDSVNCFNKILYCSSNPAPDPSNMLPTEHFTID